MDWKQYTEQPDEGMYEKIQQRLKLRRMWRIGGWVAAVVVVAAVGTVALNVVALQDSRQQAEPVAQAVAPAADDVAPDVVAPSVEKEPMAAASSAEKQIAVEAKPMVAVSVADTVVETPRTPTVEPRQAEKVVEAVVATPVVVAATADNAVRPSVTQEPKATEQTVAAKVSLPATDSSYRFSILVAPNVIVPGDDSDEVRRFKITPVESISDFSVMIFNRRGQKVFSSKDQAFAWDGTYEGQPLPQGAYVWIASFRDASGTPHTERGTVTVLR